MARRQRGQGLAEYMVLLALSSLGAVAVVSLAGPQVAGLYQKVTDGVANPVALLDIPVPTPPPAAATTPAATSEPTPAASPAPSPATPSEQQGDWQDGDSSGGGMHDHQHDW
jgi:hypothetical protein